MFIPMFDSLYIQGYTAALQDLEKLFIEPGFEEDMKRHKRKKTRKEYARLFKVLIKGRSILRENSSAFIRCSNDNPDGYEFFDETKQEVIEIES